MANTGRGQVGGGAAAARTLAWTLAVAAGACGGDDGSSTEASSTGTTDATGATESEATTETSGDGCVPATSAQPPEATELTLQSADGTSIAATFTAEPGATCLPAALLLHQYAMDRSQWEPWTAAFTDAGFAVLTIDIRGHGESDPASGEMLDVLDDPDQAPLDVAAALDYLTEGDGAEVVDAARIAVVGTSIGANLSVVAMVQHPERVGAVVPISPRVPPILSLADAELPLALTAVSCFAGALDGGGQQAEACVELVGMASGPAQSLVLPDTSAHGVTILDEAPETIPDSVEWLLSVL